MADSRQPAQAAPDDAIQERISKEYEWGFVTDIEEDKPPKGLNEDVIRAISARKNEPEWLLEYRLRAYRAWLQMGPEEPACRRRRRAAVRGSGVPVCGGAAVKPL